jgi:hypothetical protein
MHNQSKTYSFSRRVFSWFLVLVTIVITTPYQSVYAKASTKTAKIKPFVLNPVKARPKPSLKLIQRVVSFSANPTDLDLSKAHILPEQIVPISSSRIVGENAALSKALLNFEKKKNPEDVSDLTGFIKAYPQSRWRPAIELNLGILRFQTGYLTEAMHYWSSCWEKGKGQTGPSQQAFTTRAAAELAMLYARLGRANDAQKYLDELKGRKFRGGSDSLVKGTQEALALMKFDIQNSFKCGPLAVNTLLYLQKGKRPCVDPTIKAFPSSSRGTNLAQISALAQQVGLNYQMAKRSAGAPLVVPSVMHWRAEHFSAITAKEKEKFRVQDPTFGPSSSAWLSASALETESDGYFLIPQGPLPSGWQPVKTEEAQGVWGKGVPAARNNCKTCPQDKEGPKSCQSGGCGMAVASALSMNATVHIVDTPLEMAPPIGPNMDMTLTYNVAEGNLPSTPFFSTVGVNWSLNWVSYLIVDASQNLTVSVPGGGFESYVNNGGANPYAPDILSQAVMGVRPVDRVVEKGWWSWFD